MTWKEVIGKDLRSLHSKKEEASVILNEED